MSKVVDWQATLKKGKIKVAASRTIGKEEAREIMAMCSHVGWDAHTCMQRARTVWILSSGAQVYDCGGHVSFVCWKYFSA